MSDTDKTRPLNVILAEHGFTPYAPGMTDLEFTTMNNNPWINWDKLEPNHANRKMYVRKSNRAARTNQRNLLRSVMLYGDYESDKLPVPVKHRHIAKWLSS